MPEPLVSEDTSLTRLMETVRRTPGARILYQDTVRRGGMLGFFAREVHRIAYLPGDQPADGDSERTIAQDHSDEAAGGAVSDGMLASGVPAAGALADSPIADSPIAGLLAAAEAAEATLRAPGAEPAQPDFASVLRRYIAEPEVADQPATAPASQPVLAPADQSVVAPADQPVAHLKPAEPIAEVTPLGPRGRVPRHRLELLMQLRQVGVPISLNPAGTMQSPYEALEDILGQLPPAPRLPHRAGQLIVLAGDGAAALHAARTVCRMQRLPLRSIVTAGLETGVGGSLRRISSPEQAMRLREELSGAMTPSVLVVATDGAGLGRDDSWPAEMITALRPDTVWAVIDARWKSEDSQAQLARLPQTDALVVHSAELSGSPASVWELGLPIGLLDDRRPYGFVWLGMLMRLLGDLQRHQATA